MTSFEEIQHIALSIRVYLEFNCMQIEKATRAQSYVPIL